MDTKEFVQHLDITAERFTQLCEAFLVGGFLLVVWKVEDYYNTFAHTDFYTLIDGNWVLSETHPEGVEVIL